jgi:hypothetical protein
MARPHLVSAIQIFPFCGAGPCPGPCPVVFVRREMSALNQCSPLGIALDEEEISQRAQSPEPRIMTASQMSSRVSNRSLQERSGAVQLTGFGVRDSNLRHQGKSLDGKGRASFHTNKAWRTCWKVPPGQFASNNPIIERT